MNRAQCALGQPASNGIAFLSVSPTPPTSFSPPYASRKSCRISSTSRFVSATSFTERLPLRKRLCSVLFSAKPSRVSSSSGILMSTSSSEDNGEADLGPHRQQSPLQARPGLVGAVPLWIFLSLASRLQSAIAGPQKSTNVLSPAHGTNYSSTSRQNHTPSDAPTETGYSDTAQRVESTDETGSSGDGEENKVLNGYESNSESVQAIDSGSLGVVESPENTAASVQDDIAEQNNAFLKKLEEEYQTAMDALSGRIRVLEDALETTDEQVAEWRAAAERATEEGRATVAQLESDAKRGAEASSLCTQALYDALTRAQTRHAAAVKARDDALATENVNNEKDESGLHIVDVKSAATRAMFDAMMSAQTRATAARLYASRAQEARDRMRGVTLDGYKVAIVITAFLFTVVSLIVSTPSVLDPFMSSLFPSIAHHR